MENNEKEQWTTLITFNKEGNKIKGTAIRTNGEVVEVKEGDGDFEKVEGTYDGTIERFVRPKDDPKVKQSKTLDERLLEFEFYKKARKILFVGWVILIDKLNIRSWFKNYKIGQYYDVTPGATYDRVPWSDRTLVRLWGYKILK